MSERTTSEACGPEYVTSHLSCAVFAYLDGCVIDFGGVKDLRQLVEPSEMPRQPCLVARVSRTEPGTHQLARNSEPDHDQWAAHSPRVRLARRLLFEDTGQDEHPSAGSEKVGRDRSQIHQLQLELERIVRRGWPRVPKRIEVDQRPGDLPFREHLAQRFHGRGLADPDRSVEKERTGSHGPTVCVRPV